MKSKNNPENLVKILIVFSLFVVFASYALEKNKSHTSWTPAQHRGKLEFKNPKID